MKPLSYCFRTLLLISLPFIIAAGCRKTAKTTSAYDFSWSGSAYPGNILNFTTTAPAGSTLLWNFGDSSTATGATPVHSFAHPGTFAATLTVNGDLAHIIQKNIIIGVDAAQVSGLTGARTWSHTFTTSRNNYPDTTLHYADTTFALSLITPISILVGTDTLTYESATDSFIYFHHTYYWPGTTYVNNDYTDIKYNHISNKVQYSKFDHISAAGISIEVFIAN